VANALITEFGSAIEVLGNVNAPRSGAFEITLEDGTLIHSKLKGGGFPQPKIIVELVRQKMKA